MVGGVVYLDANATEPLRPEARAAVLAALDLVGNPSSVHAAGRAARALLEGSRRAVAARFGGQPGGVVFTSGGTEANAMAIAGLGAGRRLIVSAVEHDAVRAAAHGGLVLPVDGDGVADLEALARLLVGGPALVCLMLANNETGTLQPVAEAARLCRAAGALLHVDAVQAAGGVVLGGERRLPNTVCAALPGVSAETQVIALDLVGMQVSAGAACSSGKVARSHVLEAMGVGALAGQAIRVSLPWCATGADVAAFVAAYGVMAGRLGGPISG